MTNLSLELCCRWSYADYFKITGLSKGFRTVIRCMTPVAYMQLVFLFDSHPFYLLASLSTHTWSSEQQFKVKCPLCACTTRRTPLDLFKPQLQRAAVLHNITYSYTVNRRCCTTQAILSYASVTIMVRGATGQRSPYRWHWLTCAPWLDVVCLEFEHQWLEFFLRWCLPLPACWWSSLTPALTGTRQSRAQRGCIWATARHIILDKTYELQRSIYNQV